MEYPVLGEYHDNLTLDEAFSLYQAIPDERRNGIKGIGFRLEDGSSYDGDYELMRGGVTSRDLIALVPHCQESPLVQKAIKDLNALLSSQQEQDHSAENLPKEKLVNGSLSFKHCVPVRPSRKRRKNQTSRRKRTRQGKESQNYENDFF